MLRYLKQLFPGFRSARRAFAATRIRHFGARPSLRLRDLPEAEIHKINEASRRYFENNEQHEFWANKPFSDSAWAPWFLWRLGLLLSALSLKPGHRILDFGCGSGWTTIMLARMGANVVGMDIALAAIEIARETAAKTLSAGELSRIKFDVFDGNKIAESDGAFDTVVVFEALHHLPNPNALLKEFCRVLTVHGIFGFAEPGVGHSEADTSHDEAEHGVLEADLDLQELYASAIAAGFRDLEIMVPAIPPNNLTMSMSRLRWFMRGCSFLLPADLFRAAILTAPIGVFLKGPYSVTSLHPRLQLAKMRPVLTSLKVATGERYTLSVKAKNIARTVWLKESKSGRGYVRLGAHLLTVDNRMLIYDYARASLAFDIQEGQTAALHLDLEAPREPGEYKVQLDMVNEGVCWFAQEGSEIAEVKLTVSPE